MKIRKKRESNKKKRNEYLYGTVNVIDGSLEAFYDPARESFEVKNLIPGTLRHTISYKKESGKEKILSYSPCLQEIGSFGLHTNLRRNYDYLYAIDTNSKIIGSERLSIAMSYHVPQPLGNYADEIPFLPFVAFEINGVNERINPETIGWKILVDLLCKRHDLSNEKIGIVVDSELGQLKEMNNRTIPFYDVYYLPKNMQLIYASSERGEELPNQMMALCDKVADQMLAYFITNSISQNVNNNGDNNFRGYRRIIPKNG